MYQEYSIFYRVLKWYMFDNIIKLYDKLYSIILKKKKKNVILMFGLSIQHDLQTLLVIGLIWDHIKI